MCMLIARARMDACMHVDVCAVLRVVLHQQTWIGNLNAPRRAIFHLELDRLTYPPRQLLLQLIHIFAIDLAIASCQPLGLTVAALRDPRQLQDLLTAIILAPAVHKSIVHAPSLNALSR